ncbi:MAG: hypothetical protein M1826_001026 [Phylliscum demangeonii]|nr:MAG: hypothetical protein M1826_001026 [Phylliscum demangeonii]
MKSWIPCAVAIAHLFGPVWARPDHFQRIDGSSARRFGDNNNKVGAVLGTGATFGVGLLTGAALRQPQIGKLQGNLKQMIDDKEKLPPFIRLKVEGQGWSTSWHPQTYIVDDGRWMECIFEYLNVPEDGRLDVGAWEMANAVSDCGKHHGRHVDLHWFDNVKEGDMASMTRPEERTTAWAAKLGQGKEVRAAAPPGRDHFRDETQVSQFSTGPLSAAVPHWAKHLGIGAQHLFAGVAATTRRLSAVDRRVLQKEATLLRKEALAGY